MTKDNSLPDLLTYQMVIRRERERQAQFTPPLQIKNCVELSTYCAQLKDWEQLIAPWATGMRYYGCPTLHVRFDSLLHLINFRVSFISNLTVVKTPQIILAWLLPNAPEQTLFDGDGVALLTVPAILVMARDLYDTEAAAERAYQARLLSYLKGTQAK